MFKKHPLLMAEDDAGGTGGGSPDVQSQIDAAVSAAVAGLKAKNGELLGSLRETKESLKRFDGIDPDAVRNILSKFANDEEAALIAKGEIDKVLNNRTERMKAGFERETQAEKVKREAAEARAAKFSKRVLENGIRTEAAAAGLHQYAIEDALYRAGTTFALDDDGNPTAVEGAFGKDGKPLTLKEWFADMKEKAPHWFPATASGSGAGGGGGGAPGQKTMTRTQWDAAPATERMAFAKAGGKVTD